MAAAAATPTRYLTPPVPAQHLQAVSKMAAGPPPIVRKLYAARTRMIETCRKHLSGLPASLLGIVYDFFLCFFF